MVDWLTVIASVGLSVVGSMVVTEYQLRRQQSVEESAELQDWYEDTAGYAAEAHRIWQRLFDSPDRPSGNLSEIQSELGLLEGQMSRHASTGEQIGADSEVIDALDDLARECREPAERPLHMNSMPEFEEMRDDILAAADELEETLEQR